MFFLLSISSFTQINGVAGAKLNAISNFAIAAGDLEFEPTFSSSRVGASWGDGSLEQSNEISVNSGLSWRMSYGLTKNTAIGVNMPSDFSSSNIGFNSTMLVKDDFSLGFMAGLTLPFGNRTVDRDNRTADDLSIYGLGLIGSWVFNERSSLDVNIQYQDYFEGVGDATPSGLFYFADFGYYVNDGKIMLILAASYQSFNLSTGNSNTLSFYPSIAFEHSDNYVIVLNTQHDIAGRNADKSFGLGFTLTTIW